MIKTRLRSKVFSLRQILNKPKKKKEKLCLVFPSIRDRVMFGRAGGLFITLSKTYIPNLSTLLSLEPLEKFLVVGGGWWWGVVGGA